MSESKGDESHKFTFCDDDGRAKVKEYESINKFLPGDRVYLTRGSTREGPYIISSSPRAGRYILCDESGGLVNGETEVEERDLTGA